MRGIEGDAETPEKPVDAGDSGLDGEVQMRLDFDV
jgi:hypothetical protein